MDFLKLFVLSLSTSLVGCSFTDSAAPKCGAPCDPCHLGIWSCETNSCDLGELEPIGDTACSDLVFVSGSDVGQGDGSNDSPFATLDEAIASQASTIVLRSGEYDFSPSVLTDRHLIGLGSPTLSSIATDRPAITASGTTSITGVNLNIRGGQINQGFAVNGSLLIDSSALTLVGTKNGSDGDAGGVGQSGQQGGGAGSNNEPGLGAENQNCQAASGGDGGRGVAEAPNNMTPALPGENSQGGACGGDTNNNRNGKTGMSGAAGDVGRNAFWSMTANGIEFVEAQAGGIGDHGVGGGGGGGSTTVSNDFGPGGTGGGSGGCGGEGGLPGGSGGLSVGFVVADGAQLTILNSTIVLPEPGAAGRGGIGGDGGTGGDNGPANGDAGRGGIGGNGGKGGDGGHGIAGRSMALVCVDGANVKVEKSNLGINSVGVSVFDEPEGNNYECSF